MAYDYRKLSKSHWYTEERCWFTTSKPFFPKMFTNPGLLLTNIAAYVEPKLNSSFLSRQAFRTPVFNDRWPVQTGNIDMYCCSKPTALALSAGVIRRRVMEMLSVFSSMKNSANEV